MLVLRRRIKEEIVITIPDGRRIVLSVVQVDTDVDRSFSVKLGFCCDRDIIINCKEVQRDVDAQAIEEAKAKELEEVSTDVNV